MPAKRNKKLSQIPVLQKVETGIKGFDEITEGGLPKGRPTLVCGDAGCGKTLFSIEFIVQGALEYNEPGVFVAFEEKIEELAENVGSLGFDLPTLVKQNKICVDYVHIDRSEIEETGEYNLEGLFIRLEHAIKSIGAKRVVLDTVENLFSGLQNEAIIRTELRRLFQWLRDKNVTAVITGEKGNGTLTREGLEEYVSDCVIFLDHRVVNQISTRRMRIIKYRGSSHGTNEFPFLIDRDGISVLPVTSLRLESAVSSERVSTGIPALDDMIGGKGFYRGSSILISGTAGTGKTSIASVFARETCRRNERCLYFAFEESPAQIIRNMRSINIDLDVFVKKGLLKFFASRPTMYGLEMHLVVLHKMIEEFNPKAVILDPITNLITVGTVSEVRSMLNRLIDFLQSKQITVMLTALSQNTELTEQPDEEVSSLVDSWLLVRDIENNGERNRGLYIMKSRGTGHSNKIREFIISDTGLHLEPVYMDSGRVLTGTAREQHLLQVSAEENLHQYQLGRKEKQLQRNSRNLQAEIDRLRDAYEAKREELENSFNEEDIRSGTKGQSMEEITQSKKKKAVGSKSAKKQK